MLSVKLKYIFVLFVFKYNFDIENEIPVTLHVNSPAVLVEKKNPET